LLFTASTYHYNPFTEVQKQCLKQKHDLKPNLQAFYIAPSQDSNHKPFSQQLRLEFCHNLLLFLKISLCSAEEIHTGLEQLGSE